MALTGNLTETSFTDLIQFYSISRQTVAVTISSPHGIEHDGVLFIEGGDVVDARFGELTGIDAVRRALRLRDGEFRVELNVRAQARTIFEPWSKLVLEELVSNDEELSAEVARDTDIDAAFAEPAPSARTLVAVGEPMEPKEVVKICPVCRRQYLRGLTCEDDGALLVESGSKPAPSPSRPPAVRTNPSMRAPVMKSVPLLKTAPPPERSTPPPERSSVPPRPAPAPPPVQSQPPPPVELEPLPEELAPTEPPPVAVTLPPPPRRSLLLPVSLAAGAVVVIAAALAIWRSNEPPPPAARVEPPRVAAPAAVATPQVAAVVKPRTPGISDDEIIFGMAAPFSGPAKELGRGMKTGIDLAFAQANEAGGVNGRKLKLVALDDGYEPERTKAIMKELVEQRQVFAVVGNVGTPTAEVSLPYVQDKKMLFFAPFTGAGLLRKDPPDRYVFNYRASYGEETAAIVSYLIDVRRLRPSEIAVFAQEDGYGEAGFQGVAKVMRKFKRDPANVLRVGYKRNTSDVSDAVATVLKFGRSVKAVVMVATYKAAAKFIEKVKEERSDMIFTNVSFVGSTALAEELMSLGPKLAEGVIVTQVVPLPTSKATAVMRYQELLPKYSVGEKPDFVSLEGYLAANVLIDALKRAGRDLDTEKLINALETTKALDLGVGAPMSFGMSEHQASHRIWGTQLDAQGNYQALDLE